MRRHGRGVIAAIQTEEEGHLAWAAARRLPQTPATRVLYGARDMGR